MIPVRLDGRVHWSEDMPSSEPDAMSATALLKTPLHALHLELGAKMVPFAGYDDAGERTPRASSPSTGSAASRRRCSTSRTWASCA